jgi:hypothetical protein
MHIRFSYHCKNKNGISITVNVSLPFSVPDGRDFDKVEAEMNQIVSDMGLIVCNQQAHQYSSSGNFVAVWK